MQGHEKRLGLFNTGLTSMRAVDWSCVRVLILPAQSEKSFFFGDGRMDDSLRALVDWGPLSSFSEAVAFTLHPISRSPSSSWCFVSISFKCISFSSFLHSDSACSSCNLVSKSISNFFIRSLLFCFKEDAFGDFSCYERLLSLRLVPVDQLGDQFCSCSYSFLIEQSFCPFEVHSEIYQAS